MSSLNFKDVPQQGGGWFKPADHKDAEAILVEVHSFDRQRPTPNGPKDSALVDITTFEKLDGEPAVIKGTRIEQTVLARDLETLVGAATIVTVDSVAAKKVGQHPAWVWRQVDAKARAAVIAYATKREADAQAALAAAPDFG